MGNAESPEHWRDSHYRIEGPAVAQMQAAFMDNWIKTTGEVLQGERLLSRPATRRGSAGAGVHQLAERRRRQHAAHVPARHHGGRAEHRPVRGLFRAGRADPDARCVDALRRGVRVRIIVPGEHIDTEVVRKASRAGWGELLDAGAEIHEYQPTMFHCKTLIVDGLLVSVGSTNFDNRSFRLNDEANLNVYDPAFAAAVTRVFEADLEQARRITHEDWLQRPAREKLLEKAAALLSPQL